MKRVQNQTKHLFTQPLCYGQDLSWSILKRSKISLNSVFSSLISCLTRDKKKNSLPSYLPTDRRRTVGFMPFPRVSKIWTRVTDFIFTIIIAPRVSPKNRTLYPPHWIDLINNILLLVWYVMWDLERRWDQPRNATLLPTERTRLTQHVSHSKHQFNHKISLIF